MKRRHWLLMTATQSLVALGASVGTTPAAAQAAYPNKPIKLIVPLAAGSAVDNAARIVMQKVALNTGGAIAVENMAGASGAIGADRVAKSAPDGYTLGGFNDSIMTMLPNLNPKLPWDIVRDFTPIALVATVEWGLVVPADSPISSVADFIAAARQAPGRVNYGSGGNGSPQHIAMALFANQAGLQLTHVPYKGATQAAVGVAGHEVQAAFQGIATVNSLVKANRLKLIAVCTPKRLAQFPDIPTVSESGLNGYEFNSWFALMAPAGTPAPIVARLAAAKDAVMRNPEVLERLRQNSIFPTPGTPEQWPAYIRAESAKWGELIRVRGITGE